MPTTTERTIRRNASMNERIRATAVRLRDLLIRVDALEDSTFALLDKLSAEMPENAKAAERLQALPTCEQCKQLDGALVANLGSVDPEVVRWVTACPSCKRFASDEAAAIDLGRRHGVAIAWAEPPNGNGARHPYVALDAEAARRLRGEHGWTWGDDFVPGDTLDVAQHIGQSLNEYALRGRGLGMVASPDGSRYEVYVSHLVIGVGEFAVEAPEPRPEVRPEWRPVVLTTGDTARD